jgi:hypothetical protein
MNFLNVIIANGNVWPSDRDTLFPKDEDVHIFGSETDIFTLLIKLNSFPSRSQAKKNWKRHDRTGKLHTGWSEFFVGKLKRHLCIWNPGEDGE